MHFLELTGAFILAKLLYPFVIVAIAFIYAVVRALFDHVVAASHNRRVAAKEQKRIEYIRKQKIEDKIINTTKQKELEKR
ncbi:MAG: hypothetical protein ACYSOL_06690 [Planctomycetota bacterium]|jgi:hypothetical protein